MHVIIPQLRPKQPASTDFSFPFSKAVATGHEEFFFITAEDKKERKKKPFCAKNVDD